ncbi:hypothetical protein AB0M58_13190 [Streptomyces bobili]|uniref:hypothetical protein n=1 Tax=Streptomyces bobili TaxID=67280 RepID=UPI00343BDACF
MPNGENQPTMSPPDRAVELARSLGERKGPIADLAAGTMPACFGRLRIKLAALRKEAIATTAELSMGDDPDDPLFTLGQQELDGILSAVTGLDAWVQTQQCVPNACECRADRLLRQLLTERGIPVQNGVSAKAKRVTCLIAGDAAPGSLVGYVMVEHRQSIDHQVQLHGGWRARTRSQDGQLTLVYQSPGYPTADLQTYRADTLACAEAVDAALTALHNHPEPEYGVD